MHSPSESSNNIIMKFMFRGRGAKLESLEKVTLLPYLPLKLFQIKTSQFRNAL